MTLSPEQKDFCAQVSKIIDFTSQFGYVPETKPITLQVGDFTEDVSFSQVWLMKIGIRIAVTRYDGPKEFWYSDEATVANLLELDAEPLLGLANGTKMLALQPVSVDIESSWKFSKTATGPVDEKIRKAVALKLFSLILADNDTTLYKIYASVKDEKEFQTILTGLCEILKSKL